MRVLARCLHGLEWVCAAEVETARPAAVDVALNRREVWFTVPSAAPELLALRTADDVFLEVGRSTLDGRVTAQTVADAVLGLPWRTRVAELVEARHLPQSPGVDVVASVEGRMALSRFAVENTVGPRLARELGGHYLVRTKAGRAPGTPSLAARIFMRESEVTATIRLGGAPLHRRAYKQDTGPGTLHPPLAAALAQLAAVRSGEHVLDPFCGDGTIVIETGLAFPDAYIAGSDIDDGRLANAERNALRAGVPVSLCHADASRLADTVADAVITNPPWDVSVTTTGSLGAFWNRLPHLLGRQGRIVAITDAGMDVPSTLERRGFTLTLATQIRLAGRMSHLMLAGPAGRAPLLPDSLSSWRERALATGVVTATGF